MFEWYDEKPYQIVLMLGYTRRTIKEGEEAIDYGAIARKGP